MPTKNIHDKLAPINNICLMILAGTAATGILVYTKAMLMPFVIALFISMVAGTLAEKMKQKWKLPYVLGLVLSFAAFLAIITLSVLFISSSIESFIAGADIYSERLGDTIDWFLLSAQKYGVNMNAEFVADTVSKLPVFNVVKSLGGTLVSILTNLMLITLFLIFIFMGKAAEDKPSLVGNIQRQISFYLIVKIFVSLLAAGFTWIVLTSVKAELASMLAVLTFVLNFIPNIGPFISTMLPMPVLFLQYGLDWHILLALILLTAIHFVIGNILETKWLGKGMDLDPIIVIASLLFWALVWGIMGALLAVPLTAIIKMALERNETTKPLADLLAGKYAFK
ncbi:MAG: AI-2E family transporter [Elusimicrobiaceae bacterium]|uniref:AI-2E family transporter n=1 Tax=Candidatus Avelusimicrobium sp. TaxID=3048833 RepID=UPI001AFCFE37|nr:AI-2E family transporter [Elusimicrobiaceae bacterium]MBP3513881.1 AI-2E family transporter [Elusimicrobiaceae bacterium]